MRERNEEIKRLKKQVEELEGSQAQGEQLSTPPTDADANANAAASLAQNAGTAAVEAEAMHSTASVISTSDWVGDYLNIMPHTPGSDQDTFTGYGQADAWSSDFTSMGAVTDHHVLHSVSEHSMEHASTACGSVRSTAAISCCAQHHGEASMGHGGDRMRHGRRSTLSTGDSTRAGSPTLKPYTFGNNTQRLRSATSSCYDDDDGHSSHCGNYRSQTSTPWYSRKSGNSGYAADYSARGGPYSGGSEHRTMIQPLDMDSLYTQGHFLHQGLLVEPSDCGDGVTIRLQPNAANSRASLVAFMIQQHDPNQLNDSHHH